MQAVYKEDELTPASFEEAAGIVRAGLSSLIGKDPELKQTALVLGKIALESGRQGMQLLTSCHCGNVGNIKAGIDYEGMFTLYPCNEIIDGVVKWFRPEGELTHKGGEVKGALWLLPPEGDGHPQCRFRAFANNVDGIYEYLDFIFREKYRDAREALLSGNPIAYVHELKKKGYFTADEGTYAKAVAGLHAEFLARLEGRSAPEMPAPDVSHLIASHDFNLRAARASLEAAFAGRQQEIAADNFSHDNFVDAADVDEDTVVTTGKGDLKA